MASSSGCAQIALTRWAWRDGSILKLEVWRKSVLFVALPRLCIPTTMSSETNFKKQKISRLNIWLSAGGAIQQACPGRLHKIYQALRLLLLSLLRMSWNRQSPMSVWDHCLEKAASAVCTMELGMVLKLLSRSNFTSISKFVSALFISLSCVNVALILITYDADSQVAGRWLHATEPWIINKHAVAGILILLWMWNPMILTDIEWCLHLATILELNKFVCLFYGSQPGTTLFTIHEPIHCQISFPGEITPARISLTPSRSPMGAWVDTPLQRM